MPPALFRVLCIVISILIWKAVAGSFRKVKNALDEDRRIREMDDDADDSVPQAQIELEKQWREAAKRISCTFDPGKEPHGNDASIAGRFSGHAVTVKRFGRNYVRYLVTFRTFPGSPVWVVRDLETIAERILDGQPVFSSKKFFSSQEPLFYCSAETEDVFARFLSVPSNRSAVLNLVRLFPSCMFNYGGISVRLRGSQPDLSVLDHMIAIADALENPSQTPMPDLTAARKKSFVSVSPAQGLSPASATDEEKPLKRFPPIQIGAATKTSKIRKMADADFSGKTAVVRISPDSKRTQSLKNRKTPIVRIASGKPEPGEISPDANPAPEPRRTPVPTGSLSVESVCAALFSKPFPGQEEKAAFDAMKGRRVCWSGELLTVLPFGMDFVFGSRKGVKATFLIHRMTQSQFGSPVPIKAVAVFPAELQSALESGRGKTVSFEGELLKFEPFAHEIYLQDALLKT